jgi:hypothetical protein
MKVGEGCNTPDIIVLLKRALYERRVRELSALVD